MVIENEADVGKPEGAVERTAETAAPDAALICDALEEIEEGLDNIRAHARFVRRELARRRPDK